MFNKSKMGENTGNDLVLQNAVSISNLIANRAKEIQELEKLSAQSSSTKLIFQRLPKHLRRRAMSHHTKRLPRIYRKAHQRQMEKSGLPPKNKRPSRKFRRRPRNLLKRQREFSWLETHIWHAKRFQMIDNWGYRIPYKPNDKAFRACYRASAHHCLIQDISYINCVEITGPEKIIIDNFRLITNLNGLSIGAKVFKNGSREGEIVIYHKNRFPFGAIGPIKFIWKPEQINYSCLWLWIHPAFYNEIIELLTDVFELNNKDEIKLIELKHSLNRFSLKGPLAHSIVKKLEIPSHTNTTPWFTEYLQKNKTIFTDQSTFWNDLNKINSSSELTPHLILNLIVIDPRYNWPAKRTKAVKENDLENEEPLIIPLNIKYGTIWNSELREKVSMNVSSTSELIEKRKNNFVSPQSVPLDVSVVPIMLIQQPGMKNNYLGYSSGWDIILPSNWGRPFWFNFIMWGGRAGGVKETNLINFEQGIPDVLYPDTKAGIAEENHATKINRKRYFSLPPNKRINYTKNGIYFPFHFPWKILITEWNLKVPIQDFYVERNKNQLRLFQQILSGKVSRSIEDNFNCLIPVKLTLFNRGKVGKYGIICLPKETNFKKLPIEPLRKDQNQQMRKDLRDIHKKLLRKMKRKRLHSRAKGEDPISSKQTIEEYSEKMRSLWLPETKEVRNSCSREIIGFITNGDFCLSIAKCQCIGYVAFGALLSIFNTKQKDSILVRDTKSRQYHLAKMEIIFS